MPIQVALYSRICSRAMRKRLNTARQSNTRKKTHPQSVKPKIWRYTDRQKQLAVAENPRAVAEHLVHASVSLIGNRREGHLTNSAYSVPGGLDFKCYKQSVV